MGWFSKKPSSSKPPDMNIPPEGTVYSQWSCLCDDDSCKECRSLEGTAWLPRTSLILDPPLSRCKNPKGCNCVAVYVFNERGAKDTANFIRGLGGVATGKQMEEWVASQDARRRAIAQTENLPREKANLAGQFEKTNPARAIVLYRESISLLLERVPFTDALWNWRDLGSFYNRLTLLLERNGSYGEALSELSRYQALNCREFVNEGDSESLEKRRVRLEGKVKGDHA